MDPCGRFSGNIVVIGASTGGPRILKELFFHLPVLSAAVIIVQHVPDNFDRFLVDAFAPISSMPFSMARDGEQLANGRIYLAPAGVHLKVTNNQRLNAVPGERINFVIPAIDVTMMSLVGSCSGRLCGVILTGMGHDGAAGISHIKRLGGTTIAQDEKTSVIYGMPKAAFETGHVDHVLPIDSIAPKLRQLYPI